jgi:hypothetical protein
VTVFQTSRLDVRLWGDKPSDLSRIFDIYSRMEVAEFLGGSPRPMTDPATAATAVQRWRTLYTDQAGRCGI